MSQRGVVGWVVGGAAAAAGLVLAAATIASLVSISVARRLPLLFFDRLAFPNQAGPAIALLVAAALLLTTAWAVFGGRRLAVYLFPIAGWGGLLFTIVAAWPGDRILGMLDFALKAAKNKHLMPAEATTRDLVFSSVPGWVWPAAAAFLALWIGLLIAGTWHLARHRGQYAR